MRKENGITIWLKAMSILVSFYKNSDVRVVDGCVRVAIRVVDKSVETLVEPLPEKHGARRTVKN